MGRPPKGKAIERLRKALDAISELKQLRRGSPQFEKWRRNAEVAISNTFGGNTSHVKDFRQIRYVPGGVFVVIPKPTTNAFICVVWIQRRRCSIP